jgi:pimeloyl-ACP methyl ester carboxylesterase
VAVVAALDKPLAILHGEREQLVSLDYLGKLNAPTLWRGTVQVIPAAGHAPQEETPDELAGPLDQFISELIQQS